ncbi:hypothetical protein [Catellatospora sp. IY07-71]|uniref:hypothetical protein n=1 Tax=Catellatospora sp. IY07-71 TaxID=2728827 RepID=UPI001BB39073|nr:hypothetical protein [Catellatospora sp. IY07-71]
MSWVEEVLRQRRRRRTWGRIAMVLALVTPLALHLSRPYWEQYRGGQEAEARAAALRQYETVVRPAVRALLAYDYRDFDGAVAHGQAFLTGPFAAEYAAAMASLRTTAFAEQAVVTVDDPTLVLDERGQHRSEVMAYVTQRRRSNRLAGVEITYCRVLVTLKRAGSGWKVARFVVMPNSTVEISPAAVP